MAHIQEQTPALAPVARVRGPFGSEGALSLSLYPAFPEAFAAGSHLFARIDGLDVPLYAGTFERRGATGALVAFDDLDTPQRAGELVGKELYAEAGEQADDDEFYMEDLIGFSVEAIVVGSDRVRRGMLTDYYDSEANPLFELELEERPVLVPAVEEFIAGIDFEHRRLKFVLPEGLLDL